MAGATARRGAESVASVLRVIGMALVGVHVAHIVLGVLEANPDNMVAATVADLADAVDLGLSDLFLPADPTWSLVLNHGAAALAWLLITSVVVRLVRRAG